MKRNDLGDRISKHLLSLSDNETGAFRPSPECGYLGIADSKVSDLSAVVYVAELALMLDFDLPNKDKSIDYIQKRQHAEGYFESKEPSEINQLKFRVYNTCMALRGLKALGAAPLYDPRPFLVSEIRTIPKDEIYPYGPDMAANAYIALGDWMPSDCENKLAEFLLEKQDPETGWIIQNPKFDFTRNNPMTFHAARFFHLAGKRIPQANLIVENFFRVQEDDGGWRQGGVHGTFDALVALRILCGDSKRLAKAATRAGEWALGCQNSDNGFNHFGDENPSEVDAGYFQIATLIMAGILPDLLDSSNRWIGWGHTL